MPATTEEKLAEKFKKLGIDPDKAPDETTLVSEADEEEECHAVRG